MKTVFLSLLAALLVPAFAAAHPILNNKNLAKIDLVGFDLTDPATGDSAFMYEVKKAASVDKALIETLEEESRSTVVSGIFELAEKSSFKNIYVYVGQLENGNYEFCMVYKNKSGSYFVIDMNITDATEDELMLTHGIEGQQHYRVKTGRPLFPK